MRRRAGWTAAALVAASGFTSCMSPVLIERMVYGGDECPFGRRPDLDDARECREIPRITLRPDAHGLFAAPGSLEIISDTDVAAKPLLHVDRATLEQWKAAPGHWKSPELDDTVGAAFDAEIAVRPGNAERLEVIPVSGEDWDNIRAQRTFEIPLPPVPDGEDTVVVRADLYRLLHENWNARPVVPGVPDSMVESQESPTLDGIELRLHGPRGAEADGSIERLELFDEEARFPAAAGQYDVQRDGIIVPSLYVRTGARARVAVEVGEGAELRFVFASTVAGTRAVVRVVPPQDDAAAAEEPVTVAEVVAADGWTRAAAPLGSFAGRTVTVELEGKGPGVGFFGAPRVVRPKEERPPDVLVYLVDCLVATRLGAWGSPLAGEWVSPVIDRLAETGLTFEHATSASSWTKPSIPSILASVDASTHGVGSNSYTERLPPRVPLLQERFRAAGYRTGSFFANPLGGNLSGLERGFDWAVAPGHWDGEIGPMAHPTARQIHTALLDWLDAAPDEPAFIYAHTLDVHQYRRDVFKPKEHGWHRYDEAIRVQDTSLGELLVDLMSRDRELVVVLLSDHGESFWDHQSRGHGTSLYESQVHVPLILWSPGRLPAFGVPDTVSLVDVAPTLLDLHDLPPLPLAQGISLLPYAEGRAPPERDAVFVSREWYLWDVDGPPWYAATTADQHKIIVHGDDPEEYDLSKDACELWPIDEPGTPARATFASWMERKDVLRSKWVEEYGKGGETAPAQADDLERLRALGYIQ